MWKWWFLLLGLLKWNSELSVVGLVAKLFNCNSRTAHWLIDWCAVSMFAQLLWPALWCPHKPTAISSFVEWRWLAYASWDVHLVSSASAQCSYLLGSKISLIVICNSCHLHKGWVPCHFPWILSSLHYAAAWEIDSFLSHHRNLLASFVSCIQDILVDQELQSFPRVENAALW